MAGNRKTAKHSVALLRHGRGNAPPHMCWPRLRTSPRLSPDPEARSSLQWRDAEAELGERFERGGSSVSDRGEGDHDVGSFHPSGIANHLGDRQVSAHRRLVFPFTDQDGGTTPPPEPGTRDMQDA